MDEETDKATKVHKGCRTIDILTPLVIINCINEYKRMKRRETAQISAYTED
jgi:hypothetical protein